MALTPAQSAAIARLDAFKIAAFPPNSPFFPVLFRSAVADDIKAVIRDPSKINQQYSPLCGPACFMRTIAMDSPEVYAEAAINLFNLGVATIGSLTIQPRKSIGSNIRFSLTQGDWLMLASLRESENSVLDVAGLTPNLAGITPPWTLADWFKRAGYSGVISDWQLVSGYESRISLAAWASLARVTGGRVMLLVEGDMLTLANQDNQALSHPNHWIMLESEITHSLVGDFQAVSFKAYSWGMVRDVPEFPWLLPLSKKSFCDKFYGYISVRR